MSEEIEVDIDDDCIPALIDALVDKISDEQRKKDALRNLSTDSDNILEGNLKMTFSTADGFCFCSKWKRFKTWFRNIFRKIKKQCCYGTGGLRSYYDASELTQSGEAIEVNWFEGGKE